MAVAEGSSGPSTYTIPGGSQRAIVRVSVPLQDRNGKYIETPEETIRGAFSPLGAAGAAEGNVMQVNRKCLSIYRPVYFFITLLNYLTFLT